MPRDFQAGDVLAVRSANQVGRAIRVCTLGWCNHLAIVADPHGELPGRRPGLVVFESTLGSHRSCLFARKRVDGVQCHPLDVWIADHDADGSTVWHFPLRSPLTQSESESLTAFCRGLVGVPYDWWGAFLTRTLGLGWLFSTCRHAARWRWEDTSKIFCSELLPMCHRLVERFRTWNVSMWSPVAFVEQELRQSVLRMGAVVTVEDV